MTSLLEYKKSFLHYLKNQFIFEEKFPKSLYSPVNYILNIGGKRLRPILTLISTEAFGVDYNKAMPAAAAVEVFHNFSLIHDDIMDKADLRRGCQSVHKKWNTNVAILSGDVMMALAYRFLEVYPPEIFKRLVTLFSRMAVLVCEGQMSDMSFESEGKVSYDQYIDMVGKKTAVLIATAMKMGVVIAKADVVSQRQMYHFGYYLGIAFQLQDDYLDAFGDSEKFGKAIGGDILVSKKTALYTMAVETLKSEDTQIFYTLYRRQDMLPEEKIKAVKDFFIKMGIASAVKKEIKTYTVKAFDSLETISIREDKKKHLIELGNKLMSRNI